MNCFVYKSSTELLLNFGFHSWTTLSLDLDDLYLSGRVILSPFFIRMSFFFYSGRYLSSHIVIVILIEEYQLP